MIYVPDTKNYDCYVVQSEGVLRGYSEVPRNNTTISYRDFYINSNYIYKDGTTNFGSYSNLPICLSNDVITTNVFYRNDLDSILTVFLIMSIFCFLIPLKIFSRLFKRGAL